MKMKINLVLACVVLFTTISCSVQNEISTDNFKQISPSLNVKFYDRLDTIRSNYNNEILTKSFIKLFTDKNDVDYSQPIVLKLEKDKMFLHFSDTNKKEFVLQFYGKLHKNKFIFYNNYKTISFPVLLVTKEMQRFKICLSENGDLLVQKYNVNEGMFLCFGAGHSYENVYRFKII